VSNWGTPVELTGSAASRLKAELFKRGVLPLGVNMRCTSPGRMSLSVRVEDEMILREALEAMGAAAPPASGDSQLLMDKWREHRLAWRRADHSYHAGDISRITGEWRNILDPAQRTAVNAMLEPGLLGFCLFDEQGTGKTFMGLGLIHHMFMTGRVNQLLVFCPSSMTGEWVERLSSVNALSSKIKGLVSLHEAGDNIHNTCSRSVGIVTNYHQASANAQVLATWAHRAFSNTDAAKTLLIIDESFFVKNEDAQMSQAVMAIREHCSFGLVLCGTPAPNRPDDIVHQFNIADLGATLGLYRPTDDDHRNLEELSARIDEGGAFLRRLKKDVLSDLPEKSFRIIRLAMTELHHVEYDKVKRSYRADLINLGSGQFGSKFHNFLERRMQLIRLCAFPDGNLVPSSANTKFSALKEILEDVCLKGHRKLIIWSSYKDSLKEIERLVSGMGITLGRIDGSVEPQERTAIVKAFQETATPQVIIANPSAAGAGLTLHAASHAVYMSYPSQAAHFLQSIDRIHRRGQSANETVFHLLVFDKTIEEKELTRLFRKESTQADLLGDVFSLPRTVSDFIAEIND
jgi:SNF2 family DNA or RNA helicase